MQEVHLKDSEEKSSTQVGGDISQCYKVLEGYSSKVNGTCYQACVTVTYQGLVAVFGEPSVDETSMDQKVQVEWIILFDDGRVGTIYDWKEYDTSPQDVTDWHLGGHNKIAPSRVENIIKQKLEEKGLNQWGF